jgi:chemotaxis protein methyltransferase CheR
VTLPASPIVRIDNREFDFADRDFRRVCELIHQRAGIALAPAKRDMVYGRLSRRLRALGMRSFQQYLDHLENGGDDEWQAFTNALTTNLTAFFREPHHFDKLREELQARAATATSANPLLLWSCAASTGEEPYSIAITACEAFGTLKPPVRIVATDVDTQVLATAARGVYALERVASLETDLKRRYFQRGTGPNDGQCRVVPALRELIDYRPLNLLAPRFDIGGPFTALFCRNVMIYFDKPAQRRLVERYAGLLRPGGLFFAGHAESLLDQGRHFRLRGQTVYELAR